jgi:hypothetical protein
MVKKLCVASSCENGWARRIVEWLSKAGVLCKVIMHDGQIEKEAMYVVYCLGDYGVEVDRACVDLIVGIVEERLRNDPSRTVVIVNCVGMSYKAGEIYSEVYVRLKELFPDHEAIFFNRDGFEAWFTAKQKVAAPAA